MPLPASAACALRFVAPLRACELSLKVSPRRNRTQLAKPREKGKAALPRWVESQLCQLVREAPTGDEWLHEIKFDCYRMHARIDHGNIQLLTRTGLNIRKEPAPISAPSCSRTTRRAAGLCMPGGQVLE